MTAIVKHISVHPAYRRCRVVGIFDDLDKKPDSRKANLDRHRLNKQTSDKLLEAAGYKTGFQYYKPEFRKKDAGGKTSGITDRFVDPHPLAGLSAEMWHKVLSNLPDKPTE